MRSDLPDAIRTAIEKAIDQTDRPVLAFDMARIEANARAIAKAAQGITVLFAVKSFPRAEVRSLFENFDVGSSGELVAGRIVSIADPTGRAHDAKAERLIVVCETVEQVVAAPARAEIAIRVSMSITGRDPTIGSVQAGDVRRSRFGVETREEVMALHAAAAGRPVGLHVHHGPVAATNGERFLATARAVLGLADFEPRFLDLGGAWHAVSDLPRAFAELRSLPCEIIIEPGRVLVEGAGFAAGHVCLARELVDRSLRVLDLSRICHLRWSQIELVTAHPGRGRPTLFVGPTCFEDDVLGEWVCEPPATGDRVIVRNVTGYAVGWNTSFGGVPAADVLMVR